MPTKRAEKDGKTVAVVAGRLVDARRAASAVRERLAGARIIAMRLPEYLALDAPLALVLAASGADPEEDRRFFRLCRDRLLWPLPAPQVYDAISGVLTNLPHRRPTQGARPGARLGSVAEPYLLLEGIVTAARASRALSSPVRSWIVEHPGRARMSERARARLARAGVRWSALRPVRLLGVLDGGGAAKGMFPKRVPVWRWG